MVVKKVKYTLIGKFFIRGIFMEKRNIFTSIFLWLVFFMIFLYGFYEIGGYCMSKSENLWLLFVILILVLFLFFSLNSSFF